MAVRPIGPASPSQRWIAEGLGEDSPGGNPKEEKLPEALLAKFWKEWAVRQTTLRTEAGRRVRVVYPGRAGVTAGPDFRDALLEVEGIGLVRGDVELHMRQQDWDAHGYGGYPKYNGVVVHGALEVHSKETRLQSGTLAPVVCLQAPLDGDPDESPEECAGAAPPFDFW